MISPRSPLPYGLLLSLAFSRHSIFTLAEASPEPCDDNTAPGSSVAASYTVSTGASALPYTLTVTSASGELQPASSVPPELSSVVENSVTTTVVDYTTIAPLTTSRRPYTTAPNPLPQPSTLTTTYRSASAPTSSSSPDCPAEPSSVAGGGLREFTLDLTWETYAPDGVEREAFLVNGQFPGPTLKINQGDHVIIHVNNDSPHNTTIHWHGIYQYQTPWSDGVGGVTQRPIPPGGSFTYEWNADQYGSYWYHSHYIGQLDDGLYGPIIIYPNEEQETPYKLISNDSTTLAAIQTAVDNVEPLMLSDWTRYPTEQRYEIVTESGIIDVCYDSILFNGKGNINCWNQTKIQASTTQDQRGALAQGNATSLTAKGCLPPHVVALVAPLAPKDYSVLPSEMYDVCTPTTGSMYVQDVVKTGEEQWLALDLIAAFGLLPVQFSIDNHPLWIYAVDGSFIEPMLVDSVPLYNGGRFSVLIQIQDLGTFNMRVASTSTSQSIAAYAELSVHEDGQAAPDTASVAYIDDNGLAATSGVVFFEQGQQRAYPASPVAQAVDQTYVLSMVVAGETYLWAANNTVYPLRHDADEPVLFSPDPYAQDNVTITTRNGTWVDVVLVTATYPQPPHPMHKHSDKMYLIGQGNGTFPYATVAEAAQALPGSFNLVDPPLRDTLTTAETQFGPAWMAIRYYTNNPGAWFLHCHVESHLDGGMSIVIQDGIDVWPETPQKYLDYNGEA